MVNKWFEQVFLPSIFEKTGVNKPFWLSVKQTEICAENMTVHSTVYDGTGYGIMYNHNYYTCDWNGRKVTLEYSKKNGCGCIKFSMNSEELENHRIEVEAEKIRIKMETVERTKRNPERLAWKIADLTEDIKKLQATYEADLADGFEDCANFCLERIAELKAELELYVN